MPTNAPHIAQDVIRIHKVITRSLEVGLRKGKEYLKVKQHEELLGYSNYIHCFNAVLSAHHQSEDLIAFPAFRKVLPLAPYGQFGIDHQEVEKLLSTLPHAITDLPGNRPDDGLHLIIDTLTKISGIWYQHIYLEEQNFSEEKLRAVLTIEEQNNIGDATSKHSQEHAGPPFWVLPFVLYNLDLEERVKMAASLPPVIMNELIPIAWKDQWSPMKPFLLD
jgi:hemerythrin-like domain-containing protein